jgi:putative flippase GtrA
MLPQFGGYARRPVAPWLSTPPMSVALESLVPDPLAGPEERSALEELFAFALVGGSGAVAFVLLSTLVVGAPWGPPKWIGSVFCYAVLILPVYLAHRRFTFRTDALHRHAFPRYAGVQVGSLALASLFSYVVYGVIGLPTLPASMIVTGLTSAVSFLVLKFWAFRRRERAVTAVLGATAADATS